MRIQIHNIEMRIEMRLHLLISQGLTVLFVI